VAISGTLFSLLPRLPQMAIAQGGTATDLGLFSAALTFLVVFSFMNDALRTVLLPRVSSLQKPEERRRYQERLWRYTPWLLLMMVTVLLGMALLQPILLGDAYRQSVVPFLVLGTGTCALSVLGLYNILMHSYGIPRADALVNFLRLAVLAGLLIFANPTPVSVSIAYSSVMVVGELLLFFTIRRRLQGERSE
jgi:O-antigen/teichoic acid export membrane protein